MSHVRHVAKSFDTNLDDVEQNKQTYFSVCESKLKYHLGATFFQTIIHLQKIEP